MKTTSGGSFTYAKQFITEASLKRIPLDGRRRKRPVDDNMNINANMTHEPTSYNSKGEGGGNGEGGRGGELE